MTNKTLDQQAQAYAEREYASSTPRIQAECAKDYKAGFLAAQPQPSTDVPTEVGWYWIKEPPYDWRISSIYYRKDLDQMFECRPGMVTSYPLYLNAPSTQFCRALPPAEAAPEARSLK